MFFNFLNVNLTIYINIERIFIFEIKLSNNNIRKRFVLINQLFEQFRKSNDVGITKTIVIDKDLTVIKLTIIKLVRNKGRTRGTNNAAIRKKLLAMENVPLEKEPTSKKPRTRSTKQ